MLFLTIPIILIVYKFLVDFFVERLSNEKLYIYKYKQFYFSLVVNILFFTIFILFFRIFNFFVDRSEFFDLKKVYYIFDTYNFNGLLCIFFTFLFLRKIFFIFIRIHFLRLHYFFFLSYSNYEKMFFFLKNMHLNFFYFLNKKKIIYFIFYLFFSYNFKLLALFFIIKAILFKNFIMYTGFIPYYVLYYFFFSCIKYLSFFELSFDKGIIKFYYPEFFGLTDIGFSKISLYSKKLITGKSDFVFVGSSILFYGGKYPHNWLFFEYEDKKCFNILIINKKILPSFRF